MPLELQIIRAHEFIRLGAQGHFDLAASKMALAELAHACRKRGIDQAMMDLRALRPGPKPVFTPADVAALVSTFQEVGFTQKQQLAVVYHSDPHQRARLFAFLSTMHGWSVRAFSDFAEALTWLSSEEDLSPQPAKSAAETPIPVRFAKVRPVSHAAKATQPTSRSRGPKKRALQKKPRGSGALKKRNS
jgi:hypothetical protein